MNENRTSTQFAKDSKVRKVEIRMSTKSRHAPPRAHAMLESASGLGYSTAAALGHY